jgi:hypothetical protein
MRHRSKINCGIAKLTLRHTWDEYFSIRYDVDVVYRVIRGPSVYIISYGAQLLSTASEGY